MSSLSTKGSAFRGEEANKDKENKNKMSFFIKIYSKRVVKGFILGISES